MSTEQQEREAFEEKMRSMEWSGSDFDRFDGVYKFGTVEMAWSIWQARAALSAQPVALRPTDDELWGQALQERDVYHEFADDLASRIASITGVDIGEHSSNNNPWANALSAADELLAQQAPELDPLTLCECGDQFTEHDPGTCVNCLAAMPKVRDEQAPEQEPAEQPVAWVRFCSDGSYEGPIMHTQIEDVRKRSGAWTPLYLHPEQDAKDAALWLSHEHMKLYLPHYTSGHNVFDAMRAAIKAGGVK